MIRIILLALAVLFVLLAKKEKHYRKVVFTAGLAIVLITLSYFLPDMTAELKNKQNREALKQAEKAATEPQPEERLSDSEKYYREGILARGRNDLVGAADSFLKVNPKDKLYKDAMKQLTEVVPPLQDELLKEAQEKIKANDYETAATLLDKLLYYGPNEAAEKLKKEVDQKLNVTKPRYTAPSAAEMTREKRHVGQWGFGFGQVGIAIKQVKTSLVVDTNYNFNYEIDDDKGQFLWLLISAYNDGPREAKITPEDFYVSTSGGTRIIRDQATFSQTHIDDMTIESKKAVEGWIIFKVPKGQNYTLHFYNGDAGVDKAIK